MATPKFGRVYTDVQMEMRYISNNNRDPVHPWHQPFFGPVGMLK